MCVIFFAFNTRADYPLVLAANRDEFYNRPSAAAAYWEDRPDIYAGRDLVGGGTWLGVTRSGRFAAVTNYRDTNGATGTVSRGDLTADFLKGNAPAEGYLDGLEKRAGDFSGFNLILGEINGARREVFHYSNRGGGVVKLEPGIYGLSNHLLNTPWPKVRTGLERFSGLLAAGEIDRERIFSLLSDQALAADDDLPDTGVGLEIERALSAIFIKTPVYGTRCSTLLMFDKDLQFDLEERIFV